MFHKLHELQRAFAREDTSTTGRISSTQFGAILQGFGGLDKQISVLTRQFCEKTTQLVNYRAFMDYMNSLVADHVSPPVSVDSFAENVALNAAKISRAKSRAKETTVILRDLFRTTDLDEDGFVSKNDVTSVLCGASSSSISPQQVCEVFNAADKNKLGRLNFDGFCEVANKFALQEEPPYEIPVGQTTSVVSSKEECDSINKGEVKRDVSNVVLQEVASHYNSPKLAKVPTASCDAGAPTIFDFQANIKPTFGRKPLEPKGANEFATKAKSRQNYSHFCDPTSSSLAKTQRVSRQSKRSKVPSTHRLPCEGKVSSSQDVALARVSLTKAANSMRLSSRDASSTVLDHNSPSISSPAHYGAAATFDSVARQFAGKCSQVLAVCANMDCEHSGQILWRQFAAALCTLFPSLTPQELQAVCPKSELVDYVDFVTKLIARESPKEQDPPANVSATNNCASAPPVDLQVEAAKKTMRQMIVSEFQSAVGSRQDWKHFVLEGFSINDVAQCGYLDERTFRRSLSEIFRHPAPSWLVERCIKIAHSPFCDPRRSGKNVLPHEERARKAARDFSTHKINRVDLNLDYMYLLDDLSLD